jgi:hypothetical protein
LKIEINGSMKSILLLLYPFPARNHHTLIRH